MSERKMNVWIWCASTASLYSRALLGFFDWTEEDQKKNAPVLQRLVRRHPNTGRLSLFFSLSRLAPSRAGRCPKRGCICAILQSTLPSASLSTLTGGDSGIWSCGITGW